MTAEVGLIATTLAIALVATLCVALPSRVFYRALVGWLGTISPATRANLLLAWALAPALAGLMMLLLIFSPSLLIYWGSARTTAMGTGTTPICAWCTRPFSPAVSWNS
jgi:hypothetical protein